jgi:putative flippase GtrA
MQILRFLVVGVGNTCLSLAVYSGLMRVLPAVPVMAALSQIASYSSGMVLSYVLNNFWVFRGERGAAEALPGFIASQLALMLLSALAMAVATHYVEAQPELIWVSVMTLITLINFTALRKWVFKSVK